MLLLKQNIIKKRQIDENIIKLDLNNNESTKYNLKSILNNIIYIKILTSFLPRL